MGLKEGVEMSAKVVYSLADEKQDLQKQLGCMNGIFQLFNRRYFLGQRGGSGHNHKRLPPGQSENGEMEFNNASEKPTEKNLKKVGKEKHRVSVESSRNSFSSSCSSTFSSVESSKKGQMEPSSYCQIIVPEPSSLILPMNQPNLSSQPLGLRDIVKDSMYKEARGLSVKTNTKEERMGHTVKHIDSPRPWQQQESVQPRANSYDKTDRNLAKLQEVSRCFKEKKDGSVPLTPKDTPRFSYDGRESRDTLKSTVKLKELPRLSLDSRESSIRGSAAESRRNYLLRDIQRGNETSTQILSLNQEPGSNKRPSSVVARLMGLEALPDSLSAGEGEILKIKPRLDENLVTMSSSSRIGEGVKHNQVSGSPRVRKEPASPQMGNSYAFTKPPSSSRLPLEPAPWRQEGGSRGSQKPAFKHMEAPKRTEHAFPSVYGEIEKRLTELEFKKSGKDLRALKQILEAMQKTRRLENVEQPLNIESQTSKCSPDYGSFNQRSKLPTWQSQLINHPVSPAIKGTSALKRGEFPNAAIKPARLIGRPRTSDSMVISGLQKLRKENHPDDRKDLVGKRKEKDLTPRHNHLKEPSSGPLPSMDKKTNGRTQRSSPAKVPDYMTGEKSTSSRRSSETVSPRLQRTKHDMDKQSSVSTPLSDLSRVRRQFNIQPMESDSPTTKLKPKSTNSLQNNDRSCGFSSETRNFSQQGDTVSVQSENNTTLASRNETEVTSTDWTNEINSIYQPKDPKVKNFASRLIEDGTMAELATVTQEQPSPVSVLDATFYAEDSPSPVKKISNAFKDDKTLHFDEAEWNQVGIDHLVNSTSLNQCSEFNHVKLENIKHLVHQTRVFNSTHYEATIDRAATPCENEHRDHRYITEILLSSGFLEDLGSSTTIIQLHPSGNLINPSLFHILEKTKGSTELANYEQHEKEARSEKIRRKLVFDAVNDILVRKLAMIGSCELWTFPNKPRGRNLSGEKLLKELWSEIDHLQDNSDRGLHDKDDELISIISADVNRKSEDWEECCYEVPGLVLDIERLIFKDLISEVVNGG